MINRAKLQHILEYAKQQKHIGMHCKVPPEDMVEIVEMAMLQGADGNSPAIPDGYALVPIEPTKEMIDAGWSYYMTTKSPSSIGVYGAMLASAPQQEV